MTQKNGQAQLRSERVKGLIELAVQCGRHFKSPQTGYLHYYEGGENGLHHTIPILDNALFALALFRSRTMEQMNEAKELLTRLLFFHCQGNFPVYLHEYPVCRDPLNGVLLLAPFYWILKGFGHVLGQELKKKLEQTIKEILEHGIKWHQEKHMPYSLSVRFMAAVKACHRDFGWIGIGEEIAENFLEEASHASKTEHWHATAYLSDLLIALQMLYSNLAKSPWHSYWTYLNETWQRQACAYVGPCFKEHQWKSEPEAALYDLFLGYEMDHYAARTQPSHPYQLQAALLQPTEEELVHPTYPFSVSGVYKNHKWLTWQEKDWAYTVIEKKGTIPSSWESLFAPFRLVWGDDKRTHTFVCQGGTYSCVNYEAERAQVKLTYELDTINLDEEWNKQRELNFYFDAHPDIQLQIEGQTATLFQLDQDITIRSGSRVLSLRFRLEEGQGQFTGHFMRGNRSSQLATKGNNRFEAYDWHLFIRTLRRGEKCRLSATIAIK